MKLLDDGPVVRRRTTSPTVAIALGGGGARGLAHIVALEALEERSEEHTSELQSP